MIAPGMADILANESGFPNPPNPEERRRGTERGAQDNLADAINRGLRKRPARRRRAESFAGNRQLGEMRPHETRPGKEE